MSLKNGVRLMFAQWKVQKNKIIEGLIKRKERREWQKSYKIEVKKNLPKSW